MSKKKLNLDFMTRNLKGTVKEIMSNDERNCIKEFIKETLLNANSENSVELKSAYDKLIQNGLIEIDTNIDFLKENWKELELFACVEEN